MNMDKEDRSEDHDSEDVGESESTPGTSSISQVGRKSVTGQTCSLKTLIDDGVLDAGDNVLTMEYMVSMVDLLQFEMKHA